MSIQMHMHMHVPVVLLFLVAAAVCICCGKADDALSLVLPCHNLLAFFFLAAGLSLPGGGKLPM
jgi:hypothetical protein